MARTSTKIGSSKALRVFSLSAPFFLPAILVQSGLFAFLSPLPFLMLGAVAPPTIWLAALLTNSAFIWLTLGPQWLVFALPIWIGIGLSFRIFLRNKLGIYKSCGAALLTTIALYAACAAIAQFLFRIDLLLNLRTLISFFIEEGLKLPNSMLKPLVEQMGRDQVEKRMLLQLPGIGVMFLVFSQVASLWMLSKRVKGFLSPLFWSSIRFPFFLVWIAIAIGAAWVLGSEPIQWVAESAFHVLALVFALQGISVLSAVLTRFKLNPLSRWAALTLVLVLAPPFLVSLGFFDQWFDFRRKVAP
jgi:hypothetical protein